MSKLLELKEFNQYAVTDRLWVVDNEADAKALSDMAERGVILTLDAGLGNWTNSKGIGDWSETLEGFSGTVVLALSPYLKVQTKVINLLNQVVPVIKALGAQVHAQEIPNGKTIKDVVEGLDSVTLKAITTPVFEEEEETSLPPLTDDTNPADILYMLAKRDFDFHWSDEDGGFLTRKVGPKHAYIVSGGTPNLKNYLTNEFLSAYNDAVPSVSSKAGALDAIEAVCDASESRVGRLNMRSAKSASTGRIWIDLGRRDGLFVAIDSNGWELRPEADPDVFFKRTDQLQELPVPAQVATDYARNVLETHLRPAFNVSDAEWPLVLAWMVTQILPNCPVPVAMFLGESGSGKTTATSVIASVLENVDSKGTLFPEGKDNMAVSIGSEQVSVWNNMSNISKSTSDEICQYIDGSAYKKRKQYSNTGVVNIKLQPSVLLNGISFEDKLEPDMKTRSIVFNMQKMGSVGGSLDEMVEDVLKFHPQILGALYTLVSEVMSRAKNTKLPSGDLRLTDYAKTVQIIDELWTLEGAGMARYLESVLELSYDSTDLVVFKVLHSIVVQPINLRADGVYAKTFTNEELISTLGGLSAGLNHGFNGALELAELKLNTGNRVSAYLNRQITDWKKFGFDLTSHGNTMIDGVRAARKTIYFDPAKSQGSWSDTKAPSVF